MGGSKYFSNAKRGEIQELREELHANDKQVVKKTIKKVIAAMTTGRDVSALFPDMVQCMHTGSVEMKKLVYLYLINYARTQPELAILAVNSFRKDCDDPNPLIRALAVRTLGSIQLEQITESLLEPLRRCCVDSDPYVRKTAAVCICKVWHLNSEVAEDEGFMQLLHEMLGDSNPMVLSNVVASLSHISQSSGTDHFQLDESSSIPRMLAAIGECSEWGQIVLTDALCKYGVSAITRDAETIISRVAVRLSHSNQALVLSTVKLILLLLLKVDPVKEEFIRTTYRKLTPALCSMVRTESPEMQYVILRCIGLVSATRPWMFEGDLKVYFCQFNDPLYVKLQKMEIMVSLATKATVDDVLNELRSYAMDIDDDLVRHAIQGIGRLALRMPEWAENCMGVLATLASTNGNPIIGQQSAVVARDILQNFPQKFAHHIPKICAHVSEADQPDAKSSFLWIIAEFADSIESAGEIVKVLSEHLLDEPIEVQEAILEATVKLYLKCPTQSNQAFVSKTLQTFANDVEHFHLRDRAYMYWRLLSTNPEATKKIVFCAKPKLDSENCRFAVNSRLADDLTSELGHASSVLYQPSRDLIDPSLVAISAGKPASHTGHSLLAHDTSLDLTGLDSAEDESPEEYSARLEHIKERTVQAQAQGGSMDFFTEMHAATSPNPSSVIPGAAKSNGSVSSAPVVSRGGVDNLLDL